MQGFLEEYAVFFLRLDAFLGGSHLEDATDLCGVLSKTLGKSFFLKNQLKSKTNKRRCCCYCNFYYSTSCINQTPTKLTFNNRKARNQPKPTPRKTPHQPYKTKSKKPSKITYRQLSKHTTIFYFLNNRLS